MTDDDLTTANEVEYRLTKLLRDYTKREPWNEVCNRALRKTFEERYPTWAATYELRISATKPPHMHSSKSGSVKLVLKSAVKLLGDVVSADLGA